jgi:hypothetical protein
LFKHLRCKYFAAATSSSLKKKGLGTAGSKFIHRTDNTAFGYAESSLYIDLAAGPGFDQLGRDQTKHSVIVLQNSE